MSDEVTIKPGGRVEVRDRGWGEVKRIVSGRRVGAHGPFQVGEVEVKLDSGSDEIVDAESIIDLD